MKIIILRLNSTNTALQYNLNVRLRIISFEIFILKFQTDTIEFKKIQTHTVSQYNFNAKLSIIKKVIRFFKNSNQDYLCLVVHTCNQYRKITSVIDHCVSICYTCEQSTTFVHV